MSDLIFFKEEEKKNITPLFSPSKPFNGSREVRKQGTLQRM